jgi:hypothetical protein
MCVLARACGVLNERRSEASEARHSTVHCIMGGHHAIDFVAGIGRDTPDHI